MTITRKEKTMIFVLIIFLLVAGTYVLGIMPKNNEKKTLEESKTTIESDISTVKGSIEEIDWDAQIAIEDEIAGYKAILKQYSNASNNIYEEVLPNTLPGHTDMVEIANTIKNFLGEMGFATDLTVTQESSKSESKAVYSATSTYSCKRAVLYSVIDEVAKIQSYNFSELVIEESADDMVSGSFTLTLTYIITE